MICSLSPVQAQAMTGEAEWPALETCVRHHEVHRSHLLAMRTMTFNLRRNPQCSYSTISCSFLLLPYRNHGGEIWVCDFLRITDLFFRSLSAFFIIELQSQKVIHIGMTRFPTNAWTARTSAGGESPYDQTPNYVIRDHKSKFGSRFARMAATTNINQLRTPYQAPRVNAM